MTNQNLKRMAKDDWAQCRGTVIKATLLLIVFALIFTFLTQYLSGYNQIVEKMYPVTEDLLANPLLLYEPTPEFEEKVTEAANFVPRVKPAAYVLVVVITILQAMLNAGYEGFCLNVAKHKEQKARDIMCSFEYFGKTLTIIILRSVLTAIGFLLFIFPGIVIHYALSQSFMIMFDHPEYSAFRCLRESMRIMRGNKMNLFKLQFSFFGWLLLSDLIIIFRLYTLPYFGITQANFYNYITFTNTLDSMKKPTNETRSADNE